MDDLKSRDDVLLDGAVIGVGEEGATVLLVCVFIQSFNEVHLGLAVEIPWACSVLLVEVVLRPELVFGVILSALLRFCATTDKDVAEVSLARLFS